MTPDELYELLKHSWGPDTATTWTSTEPANGQCSVTALVAQDVLGGAILKTPTYGGTHFYNLVGGVRWDFTIEQFDRPIPFHDLPCSREEAMADTSPTQYTALRRRIGLPD